MREEIFIMVIDSHAHVMHPQQRQLELMAEAKIDYTVLFTTTIHPETATNMKTLEEEMNKLYDILNGVKNPLNERINAIAELATIIKGNPTKYIGFGSIPLGLSYNENLEWINRYIVANSFRGIGELAPGTRQVTQLEPLFQAYKRWEIFPFGSIRLCR